MLGVKISLSKLLSEAFLYGRFSSEKSVGLPDNIRKGKNMDIDLLLKVAGVGMIITVVCQIMTKAGKDDQSTMVSLAGTVIILILIAERVGELIGTLREVFGL